MRTSRTTTTVQRRDPAQSPHAASSGPLTPPTKARSRLAGRGVVVVALALACVSIIYLYTDYQRTVAGHREATAQRARAFLSTLEAGIQVHVRRGRSYMEDRLETFLVQLVDTTGADAIEVSVLNGPVILRVGNLQHLEHVDALSTPDSEAEWHETQGRVAFAATAEEFGRPHHSFGHGTPPHFTLWEELPPGPYRLVVLLDIADLQRLLDAARWRFVFSAVVALLAILLGATALHSWQGRRDLETELIVAEERANQQAQMAQVSAGLAHETKNPLGVVRGLAQSIVEAADVGPEARGMARDIVDEVDRTVGQINSFLSFAKPPDPHPVVVDIDALIRRLVPLFEAEAAGAGVAFESTHRGQSGAFLVEVDEGLLRRALLNLAINAVHACPDGGTVTLATEGRDDGVALHVEDTGVGIPPEDLPHVTDPYFTRFEGGTGLGLSIVARIANAHGWKLDIQSAPGQGTRVSLLGLRHVSQG